MLKMQASTPLEKNALDVLRTWNYILAPDSAAAAIYITFLYKLERIVFSALLSGEETLMQSYLGGGSTMLSPMNGYASRDKPLLIRLLNEHDDSSLADSNAPHGSGSSDQSLSEAFHATVEDLRAKLGNDAARWKYGTIHKMTYAH